MAFNPIELGNRSGLLTLSDFDENVLNQILVHDLFLC